MIGRYDSIFSGEYAEIETSAVDRMDTKANDDGMELYNEDDIRIVGKTVDEDSFWGAAILLYIENDSGHDVGISVDDMSINGFMMTPYFSTQVYDGKMSLDDITHALSELKENGIETVEDVELKFHIYDLIPMKRSPIRIRSRSRRNDTSNQAGYLCCRQLHVVNIYNPLIRLYIIYSILDHRCPGLIQRLSLSAIYPHFHGCMLRQIYIVPDHYPPPDSVSRSFRKGSATLPGGMPIQGAII